MLQHFGKNAGRQSDACRNFTRSCRIFAGILQASLCAQRCTDRKSEAGGTRVLVSFQEMAKCQSIEAVQAYGESVLSDISKHLTADQTGSKHRVILELLTYLDEHYDQDIGLSELADRAGMSTAYLSVLLKQRLAHLM